jgi:hypothetical protein
MHLLKVQREGLIVKLADLEERSGSGGGCQVVHQRSTEQGRAAAATSPIGVAYAADPSARRRMRTCGRER